MKPKAPTEHEDGLLEYLEDIIGTSQYKEPIEEALVEMERLSEDRQEKLNRLRIVEKDRNALEAKKREAEDYLRLQNEHVRALSRLWQFYLWQCLMNDDAFNKEIVRLSLLEWFVTVLIMWLVRLASRRSTLRSGSAIKMMSCIWKLSRSITTNVSKPTRFVAEFWVITSSHIDP